MPFGMMGAFPDAITGASVGGMVNSRSMQEFRAMMSMQRESAMQQRMARHPAVQHAMNSFMGDGFDPSAMDMGSANELLAQFGQHMPEHPAMNAFLPNSGFFGNHPRLSAALESGLLGAMNATNGETTGDTIAGSIRGMLGGVAQRQQMLNRQFEAPFANARMVGELQHVASQREEDQARIRLQKSQADYYDQRPDIEQAKIDAAGERSTAKINATRPVPIEGGYLSVDNDVWTAHLGPGLGKPESGGSDAYKVTTSKYGERPEPGRKNSKGYTDTQWGDLYNGVVKDQRSAGANASGVDRDKLQNNQAKLTSIKDEYDKNYITGNMRPSAVAKFFGGRAPEEGEIDAHNRDVDQWRKEQQDSIAAGNGYTGFTQWISQKRSAPTPMGATPRAVNGPVNPAPSGPKGLSDDQFDQLVNSLSSNPSPMKPPR